MAARSIASLTISFGLVSVPVKLYSATESSSAVRFNMLTKDGSRLKQQYISEKTGQVVERAEMVKGYEFEKDRYVTFSPEELKALEQAPSDSIGIVAFIPAASVDPLYYDKAYLLAPDKRGAKPYNLLAAAMRESGRCALAKWAWKAKQYVVQIRPAEDGLVLQQLLYADEVRALKDLGIEQVTASAAELKLALELVNQYSQDGYDPAEYVDEERTRILAAIDEKIAGKQVVAAHHVEGPAAGAQVIDLMDALRASLGPKAAAPKGKAAAKATPADMGKENGKEISKESGKESGKVTAMPLGERKAAKRASTKAEKPVSEPVAEPVRARARK